MITVISPAKRLNEAAPLGTNQPQFAAQARVLAKIARILSSADLCELMDISAALGALNAARFAAFGKGPAFAAAHLFDGDTYAGLEYATMEMDSQHWAEGHLRILSGLYGLLRPSDAVYPYRLEMGTRLPNPNGADLYAFWGGKIALALNTAAAKAEVKYVLNCASIEYFGAVETKLLKPKVITPVFLEEAEGSAKTISFWAKRARGAMARYVQDSHITLPADLRGFNIGGYRFRTDLSDNDRLVFTRPYRPSSVPALAAR